MKSLFKLLQAVLCSLFFANPLFATPKAVATLDWTVAETLLALGETPVAVGDKPSYQVWVAEPALPPEVVDLGVRLQPNPEQIFNVAQQYPQGLIFINSGFYQQAHSTLAKVADVATVDFYQQGEAWQNVLTATKQVATLIGKPHTFDTLHQRYLQKIETIRPLVAPFAERPIALVQFSDSRHLRIYAENSLFGAVLSQLGFQNAWQGSHNQWGFEWIDVTQLAKLPKNSRLVVVKPYPTNLGSALQHNTLWQHLALANDPVILPPIWTFGGLPAAERFAHAFSQALQTGGEQW
ncbi:iron ABC transporter substrate-binding protein [[Actinobacillus] muris]|uniref:Iron ABC transporter substrate-binding protein n=1 Tax=Muribacter muris TaxID=67855 RepID=A0A0J5P4T5_9PAST|nr:iron-siderophore ABC transporter substrate-binding protein [Muribacter muris]KMK50705.1 iron ABC transporter substrate-binding protein [[Actinobacillus] muris] [Muribacter muris]